ncbi:MAG TPA: radical SAM protein [Anaerolineales bacterium]|nr:radical SAM protein [Anaerolineales bacterium]
MGYSLGIGLTNDCNLNCAHCYRDTVRINYLSLAQIKEICNSVPVDSIGMGTGENALNPEFNEIVSYLSTQQIKLSIASNGYTLMSIPESILEMFSDVEVSIDFPTQTEQDAHRGFGNWALVHRAIERCHQQGVEVSILSTLMNTNYNKMDQMVALGRVDGCNLRVNAYQAVKTDAFRLSYSQFWEGYRLLFSAGLVVGCAEPVVRAVMGLPNVQSPCGRKSIRINPRGQVIPCVYWPNGSSLARTTSDLVELGEEILNEQAFQMARFEPSFASDCACRGGCASRRALNGRLDAHDEFCPWVKGEVIDLNWNPAPAKDLMRIGNVCTTIIN